MRSFLNINVALVYKFSSGLKFSTKQKFEVKIAYAGFNFKRNCLLKQNFEPFLKLHFLLKQGNFC
jgi:hypothetical protein